MGDDDKDYTITIGTSEDIGGWDNSVTINGLSYSAPTTETITLDTSYTNDTGSEYTFNMPSDEMFVDKFELFICFC